MSSEKLAAETCAVKTCREEGFRHVDLEFPALPDGYQLDGSLPPTGGTSPSKPMLAVFLLLGSLATISGLVAVRQW